MCTSHPLVKTFASFVLFKTRSQEPLRFSSLARITSPLFQHDSNLGGVRFKCNWKRRITYSRWRYENKVKLHSTYISTVKNKGIVYVGFNSDFGESRDLNYTQQCQGFLLASPATPIILFSTGMSCGISSVIFPDTNRNKRISGGQHYLGVVCCIHQRFTIFHKVVV